MHPDNLGFLMIRFILYLFIARTILFTAESFLIYSCLSSFTTTGPGLSGTVLFMVFIAQVIGIGTIWCVTHRSDIAMYWCCITW